MPMTADELDRFHSFAHNKLGTGGADSLQELVDLWTAEAPDESQLRESMEALRRGLADAQAGRVRAAVDVFGDLAERYDAELET